MIQSVDSSQAMALAGIRVIEICTTIAGPACGRLLADFGADVIKIEPPEGDPVRQIGSHVGDVSLYAASILRGKRSMVIDLKSDEGREIALALIKGADVVLENNRPGVLERMGLGYDTVAALNPGIVYVRISGYGQDGPRSQLPGYGAICEAFGGVRHMTGDPDRPPTRVAVSMTDYITGLYSAFGATLALLAREKSGRGQYIDSALYECAFSFMEPWIPAYEKLGHVATRSGSRLPESTPNNLYPTQDGEFIHITAMGEAVFRRLAVAMGQPGLADDARFSLAVARSERHEELDDLITHWTMQHGIAELESVLAQASVPATRVFTIADIFGDPHYRARGAIVRAPDDELGEVAMAAVVPRLSETPGAVRHAGHRVGQDTRRVLSELLGFSAERIDALAATGIVTCNDATTKASPGETSP